MRCCIVQSTTGIAVTGIARNPRERSIISCTIKTQLTAGTTDWPRFVALYHMISNMDLELVRKYEQTFRCRVRHVPQPVNVRL